VLNINSTGCPEIKYLNHTKNSIKRGSFFSGHSVDYAFTYSVKVFMSLGNYSRVLLFIVKGNFKFIVQNLNGVTWESFYYIKFIISKN